MFVLSLEVREVGLDSEATVFGLLLHLGNFDDSNLKIYGKYGIYRIYGFISSKSKLQINAIIQSLQAVLAEIIEEPLYIQIPSRAGRQHRS